MDYKQTCSQCGGTGEATLDPPEFGVCSHCNGSGREPEDHTVHTPIYQYEVHAS